MQVDIDTSIYCGICGAGICSDSTVEDMGKYLRITATCKTCQRTIQDLEAEVEGLNNQILGMEKDGGE